MNPCFNNGLCTANATSYNCSCQDSHYGSNCEFQQQNSTILSFKEFKKLNAVIELHEDYKWKLIYRASEDGFDAKDFHLKCNNAANTLTLIKTTNSYVFGGYTEANWSQNEYKFDREAFIFSFFNKDNKPLKMNWKSAESIRTNPLNGPAFGNDIFISNNSNINSESYSDLGSSYIHPNYSWGTYQAQTFLAGFKNFRVFEIEVFTKNCSYSIDFFKF